MGHNMKPGYIQEWWPIIPDVCLHMTGCDAVFRTFPMGFLQYLISVWEELATAVLLDKKKASLYFFSFIFEKLFLFLGRKVKEDSELFFYLYLSKILDIRHSSSLNYAENLLNMSLLIICILYWILKYQHYYKSRRNHVKVKWKNFYITFIHR